MTTSSGHLLDELPTGLSEQDAVAAIAAVARHVCTVRACGQPEAFRHVTVSAPHDIDAFVRQLPDSECTPDLLGLVWERLLADASRRSQGAHFTPKDGAERVVRLTFGDAAQFGAESQPEAVVRVWDPAAGGGAFLLAAARALAGSSNRTRGEIVSALYASDIDPVALRVCDTALFVWSNGEGRINTAECNALVDLPSSWPTDFSLIVGNPPFLGQLTSDTSRSSAVTAELKAEYGALVTGYVDQSALFVELGLRRLRAGGALGLLLPQSILGARDAAEVRRAAADRAQLTTLWVDHDGLFDASVDVLAVVMVARSAGQPAESTTRVAYGDRPPVDVATPPPRSWAPLLAAVQGVPIVARPRGRHTVGDIANVTAGFRQHFYGIADAIIEDSTAGAAPADEARGGARLVTSGLIDPLWNHWGQRGVKFAGRRWIAPLLMVNKVADPAVRAWFGDRLVPKILLASQTPVIEAVVDPDGALAPSVPVISVEPLEADRLWHLAAVLSAPTTSAVLLADAAGTGLSTTAVRVRARSIGEVALPAPSAQWDAAARAAEAAHRAWIDGDADAHGQCLFDLAVAMGHAYQSPPELVSWWMDKQRKRR